MAVDVFLKIEGIDGESQDEQHKAAIDVESFSWGVSQTGIASATGGAGAGKAQFQDFHFAANTSKASPKLMLACASGQHIKKAELFCRKAGGDAQGGFLFMKLTFTDVMISSYQQGGSNNNVPSDQVGFHFDKFEFIWFTPAPDGGVGSAVSAGWDLKANKKI